VFHSINPSWTRSGSFTCVGGFQGSLANSFAFDILSRYQAMTVSEVHDGPLHVGEII